jgi:hypothetical protein
MINHNDVKHKITAKKKENNYRLKKGKQKKHTDVNEEI